MSDVKHSNSATFAGGCFWCTEAVFKRVKGVISVTSGYTGGKREKPTYEQIASEATGHAEAVQVTYDPKIISYETLLAIFWATHDPTTLNQQGYDVGTQYRSVIFYHDEKQKELAEKSKKELEKSKQYKDPIVTTIEPFTKFYEAEGYHKDYYDTNRNASYCRVIIDPKIRKLMDGFEDDVKEEYK